MNDLITQTYGSPSNGLREVSYANPDGLAALLVGHKVEKVADDHLRLDDGTLLRVVPNEGGCLCGAGDYALTALNDCDNVITKVELVEEETSDDEYEPDQAYRLFVFAEDKRINLFSVEGNDGNGYYGTGFHVLVREAGA